MDKKNYISVTEASELLTVKQQTLYAWAAKGIIPSYKFGRLLRFNKKELDSWAESQRAKKESQDFSQSQYSGNIHNVIENIRDSVLNSAEGKARGASRKGGA